MLIRFVAKNVFSFDEETEFNLLPNKTKRLQHHKVSCGDINFLRFSAIYGANASGKSNLIKIIDRLDKMIENGKIISDANRVKFKLKKENINLPISIGIEFMREKKIYYYSLTFNDEEILNEYLAESTKEEDILIFDRNLNEKKTEVEFFKSYYENDKNKLFAEVLSDKLIAKNELLLTFLANKYEDDFIDIKNAFDWFNEDLVIIKPDSKPGGIAHILDIQSDFKKFANDFIPSLNTGIASIEVDKKKFDKFEEIIGKEEGSVIRENLKKSDNEPDKIPTLVNKETGEEVSIVYENDDFITKRLITNHKNNRGENIRFNLGEESDGTRRLIDYIFAFEALINSKKVFLIDEIERSIHPIMIKEIIEKISHDKNAKGQLIFTTHESNLLDQEILRTDEIWFAQKDLNGATKLYSLSDFKVHNTIDIQNGYLDGRYGGIPFLSNLKDLNWHKYEVSEQE